MNYISVESYFDMSCTYAGWLMKNPTDSGSSFAELEELYHRVVETKNASSDTYIIAYGTIIANAIVRYLRAEGYGIRDGAGDDQ